MGIPGVVGHFSSDKNPCPSNPPSGVLPWRIYHVYCLAKAVHSLARIRFANCLSGFLQICSHLAVHLYIVSMYALVGTPDFTFPLAPSPFFFWGGGVHNRYGYALLLCCSLCNLPAAAVFLQTMACID